MPDFYLKRGDTLSQIQVQLLDGLGVAVNLYGTSVKFIMRNFTTGQIAIMNDALIIDPDNGMVEYTWQPANLVPAGDYFAEWQIAKTGSSYQTFPTQGYHLISVLDDLDSPTMTAGKFTAVRRLRGWVAENSQDPYTDTTLSAMIDRNGGDVFTTAAEIWRQKAAAYSELVDVSESGNSQKLSQLYKNALEQAEIFDRASVNGGFGSENANAVGFTGTRPIQRV